MSSVAEAVQWWNLIYVIPFALGALLAIMSIFAGGRQGIRHHISHAHATHGHFGHAHSAHSGHAGHSHAGHGSHSHAGHSHAARGQGRHASGRAQGRGARHQGGMAAALHIENIPPLMLLQNFLLFWGVCGWGINQLSRHQAPESLRAMTPALLATLGSSFVLTIGLSAVLARFTPGDESFVSTKHDLEGRAGEAVSAVSETSGSVYLRDGSGTLHHLTARVRPGAPPVARGTSVLVVEYEPQNDHYSVKAWEPGDPPPSSVTP